MQDAEIEGQERQYDRPEQDPKPDRSVEENSAEVQRQADRS
jgi:hypothetical protein